MNTDNKQFPTPEEVRHGRAEVMRELSAAQREHDDAAYEAASAMGNSEARARLVEARRRLGALQSELDAMEGVEREAHRRKQVASLAGRKEALVQRQDEAFKAIDTSKSAFDKMLVAIERLGVAWAELKAATSTARDAELMTFPATLRANANANATALTDFTNLVGSAMLNALNQELDHARISALSRTPEFILAEAQRTVERAKQQAVKNVQLGIAECDATAARAA